MGGGAAPPRCRVRGGPKNGAGSLRYGPVSPRGWRRGAAIYSAGPAPRARAEGTAVDLHFWDVDDPVTEPIRPGPSQGSLVSVSRRTHVQLVLSASFIYAYVPASDHEVALIHRRRTVQSEPPPGASEGFKLWIQAVEFDFEAPVRT